VAIISVTVGCTFGLVVFPFVYGDPGPDEKLDDVPGWVAALGVVEIVLLATALTTAVIGVVVRHRRTPTN
jgi:predicted cobalt transporter CbtA